MTVKHQTLLNILLNEITPAIGCTEPAALAYSAAAARNLITGVLQSIDVSVSRGLYKNALRVGIPGLSIRGSEAAVAIGYTGGNYKKGLRVIEGITQEDIEKAKMIIDSKKINVHIKDGCERLFIETIVTTDTEKARVVILDKHTNIVCRETGKDFTEYKIEGSIENKEYELIQKYDLSDFLEFANNVDLEQTIFLQEGIKMNLEIAKANMNNRDGIGGILQSIYKDIFQDEGIYAQALCATACEARMAGIPMPVMSCAGSGNHGILVTLTNFAFGEKYGVSDEKMLRATILSALVTIYAKSFTGILSAMCGCSVAAAAGSACGIVYQLGGNKQDMFGAVLNVIGTITGMICDGAKEGCAYKLAVISLWTIQSAFLSKQGAVIDKGDGILAGSLRELFEKVGHVCSGMHATDRAIVEVMCS